MEKNIEKMSKKEVDALSAELGQKINAITARAVTEANLLLEKFGVTCKMQIVIEEATKIVQENHGSEAPEAINKGKKAKGKSKKSAAK
jgi:hypothetical protein